MERNSISLLERKARKAINDKYIISHAHNVRNRMQQLRPILLKRKSAFNIYEWILISELLNLTKNEV